MERTIVSLMTALLLMSTFVPFSKALAQGLVEDALVLLVVGVGPDEKAEIHWFPGVDRGASQGTVDGDRLFKHDFTFTVSASNASDPTCTQTFKASVEPHVGLNILGITKDGGDLIINGGFVEAFDACLVGADRIVYQVGIPVPPGLIQQEDPDPQALALQSNHVQISSYSIVGPDGGTRATHYIITVFGSLNG